MPSDNPQTPQSPSQTSIAMTDLPSKTATSPRNTHSLPTPAHSINGSIPSGPPLEGVALDETSNKRKRDNEDFGERDSKKVHVEDSRLSIDDLHIDVGPKYLLCRTPHPMPRVDISADLFERYNFYDLAKSVARKDANNPDGISIRKTYKSVFKKLAGNFDVEKKDPERPDTLSAMMATPAEEWDAQFNGNEISKGLSETVTANMGKAFTMSKGGIPRSLWNSTVLGEVAAPVVPAKAAAKPVGNAPKLPQAASALPVSKEIPRPKRNVKKRAYGDSSFEGYGEGFVDDDLQEAGYSTGDGEDRGGSRKRPKKTAASHNFQQGPLRQNSYGPGMVGA